VSILPGVKKKRINPKEEALAQEMRFSLTLARSFA
jgi:hypothetical protein